MLDLLFVFFLLFGYKFGVFDTSFFVPMAILFQYSLLKKRSRWVGNKVTLPNEIRFLMLLMFFILILSILSALLNSSNIVLEYILKPVKVVLIVCISYWYLKERGIELDRALKVLCYVASCNSIVVMLQYMFDYFLGIKDFMYHPEIGTYTPFRKPGLTSGFPTSGLISAIGAFISFYFYMLESKKKWLLLLLLMCISVFLSARSSMYAFLLIMPVLILYYAIYFKRVTPLLIIPSLVGYIVFASITSDHQLVVGTVSKMFANIFNYLETGSFHDYSTSQLVSEEHLSYPSDIKTFLIGNSLPKTTFFQPSDISFVRVIWSNGIFSLLTYILAFFYICYLAVTKTLNKAHKVLFSAIFVMVFILLFKGPYLFSSTVGPLMLFLFALSISNKKQRICFQ